MKDYFTSRVHLSLLKDRIHKAEETEASKELYRFLWNLFRKNDYNPLRVMVVGAGGSYPAALSAAHSIRYELRTPYVEAVYPQTALRILGQFDRIVNCNYHPKYDVIIAISYSGKTPDIKAVYESCRKHDLIPFVLLTGEDKEKLKDIYLQNIFLKIISYYNPEDTSGKENSMISMFSTLAPVVLFDDYVISSDPKERKFKIYKELLDNGEEFVSKLPIGEIAKSLKKHPVIHVLYEWKTYPTAKDIESKFMESGIASVVLHEKKNFSHGCYTMLYKQDFGLIINLVDYAVGINVFGGNDEVVQFFNTDYDRILAEFLMERCVINSSNYIEMGNGMFDPAEWNVEELSKLPYLITVIGEALEIDIAKPFDEFPKETKALYKYEGEF